MSPGKDPVPIVDEVGWAPGPVWTGAENLSPTGIRSPDRPARSQSLYRLHYPAHVRVTNFFLLCDKHLVSFQHCDWKTNGSETKCREDGYTVSGRVCPLLAAGWNRGSRRRLVLSDIWCQIRAICFKHHNEFQVDHSPEDSSKREMVSRCDGITCIENVGLESDRKNIWTKGSRSNRKWCWQITK